jgi:hypothetical protein
MLSTCMLFRSAGAGGGLAYLRYTSVSDGRGARGGASSGGIEVLTTALDFPASAPRSAIT